MKRLKILLLHFLIISATVTVVAAQDDVIAWRQASEKELAAIIPARATVEQERIETELRTASGVTDGKGRVIAGVVMITAGYSAEGKYSHWVLAQAPIKIGGMSLKAGEYVFGYKRINDDTLEVKFYEALSGKLLGAVNAVIQSRKGPIRSLLITPPANGKALIQIGRFAFDYSLEKEK